MQSVVFVMFLLSSTLAFAQNRVTGTVKDKTGMPLPGVNVLEKGTTNGSITDVNGKYIINVERARPFSSLTSVSRRRRLQSTRVPSM